MFIVYSKPNCTQCTATKRFLDKNDQPYEERDATSDEGMALAREHSISTAPIVVTPEGEVFGGFAYTKLQQYKKKREVASER